ncbi:hypothetical protein ACJMK2_039938, partial [Sinanodonta woodiana]
QYVHRINIIAGRPNDEAVDTEYDVSYPSRPQAGCEASTQSFAPLIERNTRKKLVISLQVGNKLCRKSNCNHKNNTCKKILK